MAKRKKNAAGKKNNGATVGYETQLWQMADALRGSMDAAEYKHVVLGLIFLKYISDAFVGKRAELEKKTTDPKSEWYIKEESARYQVMEDRDEYLAENIFWVPPEARWDYLQKNAKRPL